MRRGGEKHQLTDAEPEDVLDAARLAAERSVETMADQRVDLSESPEGGGDQQPREGSVADLQAAHAVMAGERLVEAGAPGQDRAQDVEGGGAGGERRCVRWGWHRGGVARARVLG